MTDTRLKEWLLSCDDWLSMSFKHWAPFYRVLWRKNEALCNIWAHQVVTCVEEEKLPCGVSAILLKVEDSSGLCKISLQLLPMSLWLKHNKNSWAFPEIPCFFENKT